MPKRTRSLDSGSEVEANATDSTQPLVQDPGDAAGKRPNLASTDTDSTSVAPASPVISCSLALHKLPIPFYTYEDYDNHYHATHMNRCPECGRNFPLAHYLALHIEENHDAFFETRKGRGEKMYGCFVEGCERRCSTPEKRRRHLIDKHFFPRTYNFSMINHGIDGLSSMLRTTRRISPPPMPRGPTSTPNPDTYRPADTHTSGVAVENLSASIANLSLMPRSIQIAASKNSQSRS